MKYILFFVPVFFLLLIPKRFVKADSTSSVNATIQMSICGNGIVEGGEECDVSDFKKKACSNLGYTTGILTCDKACSYDSSFCTSPPSLPVSNSSVSTSTNSTTGSTQETSQPSSIPFISTSRPIEPLTGEFLNIFDPDKNGRIEVVEIFDAVKKWADAWKKFLGQETASGGNEAKNAGDCDINNDKVCDLRDFSILLFSIQK